jgi:hypothetical protein
VIIVTNALKQFITWNLKDEFLPCEASAFFLQVVRRSGGSEITENRDLVKYDGVGGFM